MSVRLTAFLSQEALKDVIMTTIKTSNDNRAFIWLTFLFRWGKILTTGMVLSLMSHVCRESMSSSGVTSWWLSISSGKVIARYQTPEINSRKQSTGQGHRNVHRSRSPGPYKAVRRGVNASSSGLSVAVCSLSVSPSLLPERPPHTPVDRKSAHCHFIPASFA